MGWTGYRAIMRPQISSIWHFSFDPSSLMAPLRQFVLGAFGKSNAGLSKNASVVFICESIVPDIISLAVFAGVFIVLLVALLVLLVYERKTLELKAAIEGGHVGGALLTPTSRSMPIEQGSNVPAIFEQFKRPDAF